MTAVLQADGAMSGNAFRRHKSKLQCLNAHQLAAHCTKEQVPEA